MLIWCHISSSVGHFISRVHLPYVTGKTQQGQVRKSQPTEEDACGLGAWLKVGQSVPTLWELLSPLTGELQDLLAVTGLRGGLPKTSISLFKSAWKSHKKLVSSYPHSPDFRRSFPVLPFHAHSACQTPEWQQRGKGVTVCRLLFWLPILFTPQALVPL